MRKYGVPLVACFLTFLFLAGCFQKPTPPACEAPSCPSTQDTPGPTTATTTTSSPPIVVVDQVNRTMFMQDCWGVQGFADVPIERVEAKVPSDFEIFGPTTNLGRVYYGIQRCGRVTINNTIFSEVGFYEFAVFVTPKNDSWGAGAFSNHYVLETRLDPQEAAREAETAGFGAAEAEILFENITGSGPAPYVQRWLVKGPTSSLAVDFATVGPELARGSGLIYQWSSNEEGVYQRHEETFFQAVGVELEAVPASSTGTSETSQVLGDVYPTVTQRLYDANYTRIIPDREFKGEGR